MIFKSSWLRWLGMFATVVAPLSFGALPAAAGPVGAASGFEDDDGNLAANPSGFDWNSFDPTTWTGTAPNRISTKTVNGWVFLGLEDAQATNSDNSFAGGTKQDDNCPTVSTGKASNKDDLKRAYITTNTVNGHVYVNLAWVRITQNTTSPSAHVGFEFNQGQTACGAGHGSLVQRTAGDMLIVYDFEGGGGTPTITLRRWVTSGACEVGADSPPCWGPSTDLTAGGFAEAKVNTTTTVLDQIAPTDETLGLNEFGEAGIDLTAAGVFQPGVCTGFGSVYAVSRSSGNSVQAQMKDLVGPGDISISNCGGVIIRKVTVPSPDPTDSSFGYTATGGLSPASFTLKNGGSKTYSDVQQGSYSVNESAVAANFDFTSVDCTASDTSNGTTIDTSAAPLVSFSLKPGDTVDCTYTNTRKLGAIKITKTSSKGSKPALAGASFSITGPNSYQTTVTTNSAGTGCVDSLPFGNYTVTETAAPSGYAIDDSTGHTVTVDNSAKCSDNPYVGETISFTDTPLSDIQVNFRDGGSAYTTATISCDNTTGTSNTTKATGWDTSLTVTGVKAPTTIHCTIAIDP